MSNEDFTDREWSFAKWASATRGKVGHRGFQRDLAREFGVSTTTASCWVAGLRKPGREHWPALARLIGVEVEEITRRRKVKR